MNSFTLHKFPSIEQFRNAARNVQWKAQFQGLDADQQPIMNRAAVLPKLKYFGTEKLHGSNCSVVIKSDRSFYCQSRERIIQPGDDNYGFAQFINNLPLEVVNELYMAFDQDNHSSYIVVIYGEWAGKGIQNKVAISEVDKFWAIFAALVIYDENDENAREWADFSQFDKTYLESHWNNHRIFSIYQGKRWDIEIDFERPAESLDLINNYTLEVEKESPFGLTLGVSGIGEGIVWQAAGEDFGNTKFWFKVKGQEHAGSHVKTLAKVDIEKAKTIEGFVDKNVNIERLTQGFNYLKENNLYNKAAPQTCMGDFLRFIANDILKECNDELEASGLNKKDVGGEIAKKARIWYFQEINKI